MKKDKKRKAAKKKQSLLGGAAKSLKKLSKGTATGVGRLSTTQKIVTGVALGALGISYLMKQLSKGKAAVTADDVEVAEHHLASLGEEADAG
ncbi:hypothetical protein [Hymenobacter sp. BRD67]|uniref:hypothetical protein n=1 Tax=Hymenobacter sp. BRD67 TaxID=2675877 RepID=UPI0015677E77|nr:hypothetical protein [Hymenobacter sp. BRD67]QKG54229.1 hypothetical protein GKZ67_18540 [Hymenobacter sp. BRD67]